MQYELSQGNNLYNNYGNFDESYYAMHCYEN